MVWIGHSFGTVIRNCHAQLFPDKVPVYILSGFSVFMDKSEAGTTLALMILIAPEDFMLCQRSVATAAAILPGNYGYGNQSMRMQISFYFSRRGRLSLLRSRKRFELAFHGEDLFELTHRSSETVLPEGWTTRPTWIVLRSS